jgi:hypothetical protein
MQALSVSLTLSLSLPLSLSLSHTHTQVPEHYVTIDDALHRIGQVLKASYTSILRPHTLKASYTSNFRPHTLKASYTSNLGRRAASHRPGPPLLF